LELKLIKDTMMVESMMQSAYAKGSIRPSRQGFFSYEESKHFMGFITGFYMEF